MHHWIVESCPFLASSLRECNLDYHEANYLREYESLNDWGLSTEVEDDESED